jgi:hypothetical protein
MSKPTDPKVWEFLEGMNMTDPPKYAIIETARSVVFDVYPDTREKMMYGGIIFALDEDYGGIFSYTNHVSFEFSNGYLFEDPEKLLEGKGKFRRHLKMKSLEDVQLKRLSFYLKQA